MASATHRIRDIQAFAVSFPIAPENAVQLGMGRAVKKDAVVVKVTTDSGLVGWGESHHGKAHTAVAQLVNTTLRQLAVGMDATDVVGVWDRIYWKQLASHGVGAGCAMAMSGIDLALWDIRGKAVGWPLYKLLGGSAKAVPAYAGGVSLGFQDPAALVDEALPHIEAGYRAIKLRVGDSPARDLQRVKAVRQAVGDEVTILVDANTGYDLNDARQAMPGFDALGVAWLEEPFAPHDHRSYRLARGFGRVPLAAGENHFTRYEFSRVIEDGDITILQPDLSKAGGITELLRIAAMASAYKLPVHPHTCMTGINMAASIHFLAAIDNGGYFEGDVSKSNLYRDSLVSRPFQIGRDGCVRPLEAPGIGVEVDEAFLKAYPPVEGPGYV
ncbi:mandelate racemase/muconate lactonizing enzyme family protein [Aquincola tertiaricarbonis]|uniref:Mandelate racemase/muconate lactonizing enzyme family protein n=1 Tax=Aquincola tertiaricarbonis TaxID=391953 RepID=A0ABY4S2S4_AQUTE|nr:mandelate racemase/muconate lactonizing enzyme family protein [Aquincola tertiaricarbonis]URI06086.1 mandelate racemase/muconate lactonizing enzyme family protein [Aquincola tertiaricarbonis]